MGFVNLAHGAFAMAGGYLVVSLTRSWGIGFIPWSPLSAGDLSKPGGPLDQIAKRHNAQPSQIALAWLLQRSSTMLPIPGTSTVKHLEENVAAATIKLSQEEFDSIDQSSK